MADGSESERTRFVEKDFWGSKERFCAVHIGFLINDKKGTMQSHFIPPEYEEMMMRDIEEAAAGSPLTYSTKSPAYKARERYMMYKGSGPFSWIYGKIRDVVAAGVLRGMDFKHCEIAFDRNMFPSSVLSRPVNGRHYGEDCLVAYGTNLKDGQVFRKPRTFVPRAEYKQSSRASTEEPYEWIHLMLPESVVRHAIKAADQELGKPYDPKPLERMFTSPTSLKARGEWNKQEWHCTNLTVHILQQIGFLNGLDPNSLTADDVYYYLKKNKHESDLERIPADTLKTKQMLQQQLSQLY